MITGKDFFQCNVDDWMQECFGAEVSDNETERCHRFVEESLELVQSLGCTKEDVLILVDYVFSRPVGKVYQEVGGVMVTLAALCNACGVNMSGAGNKELGAIWNKIDKIRAKHATKPIASPLTGTY